jgi:hypothetical protein
VSIVVVVGGSVVVVVGGAVATGGGIVAGTVVGATVVVVDVLVVVGTVVDGLMGATAATGTCDVVGGVVVDVVVVDRAVDVVAAAVVETRLPVVVCSEPESNRTPAITAIAAADTKAMITAGVSVTVRTARVVRNDSGPRGAAAAVVFGCRRDLTRRVRVIAFDSDASSAVTSVEPVSTTSGTGVVGPLVVTGA